MESMMASGSSRGRALNWAANKDLKATTGNSYETGLKYHGDISEASSYSLSAKYFMTKYKNLIVDSVSLDEIMLLLVKGERNARFDSKSLL